MMGMLELQRDAKRLNEIVNHPEVYPWVRGMQKGPLDLTQAFEHSGNVCLLGKYGGIFFHQILPAIYEAHTQILPEGRGAWALDCVRACLLWLFTRTDAMEVMTRCPKGNIAAKALTKAIGGTFQFHNPAGWSKDDKPIPADIYSMTAQDWMRRGHGLVERGQWFHQRFAELTDKPYQDDETGDRYAGIAYEMIIGGQPIKAMALYNRFAFLSGYWPLHVLSLDPMRIDVGGVMIENIVSNDFSVAPRAEG
jgi:hypothetical protein